MEKNEILLVHGENPFEMAKTLAEKAGLSGLIGDKKKSIGIKPNLVLASPAWEGATTHPQIVAGLIEYLRAEGFTDIKILEGAWVGARTKDAFDVCGYTDISQKYDITLVDLQKDKATMQDCGGMKIEVCNSALAVDFMINLPVQKGHCQTVLTCALKNNKGVISNSEKRHFHAMGLHKPIAHLNLKAKNDFILVDAICGDLDFEEGGNPIQTNMMYAALDPVLCDAFAASQMGISQNEVPYISYAEELGIGTADLSSANIIRLNEGSAAGHAPKPQGRASRLAGYTKEDSACSACYASLIRALSRANHGSLKRLPEPICIGQGYVGKKGKLGVGKCTAGFEHTVGGCPPSADDILRLLENI